MHDRDDDPHASVGSLGERALAVVRAQLDTVLAHEAGTRQGSDPEELHDMRVATRRLRAALKVFADVLPPATDALRQELGWLGRGLAGVRDLDVQLIQLRTWRQTLPAVDRAGLDALSSVVAAQRETARDELLALLDSERYAQLVARAQDLKQTAPRSDGQGDTPATIARTFRKLRKLGDTLDARSPARDLHALRIRAKRLRYAVEFVSDVYGRPARRFLSRVVELQDLLGSHQDTQVASDRLRSMVRDNAADLPAGAVFVMGELTQRYADEALDLRSHFEATYARATGRRWRKLEDVLKRGDRAFR